MLAVVDLINILQCHNSSLSVLFGHFCMYQLLNVPYEFAAEWIFSLSVERTVILLDRNLTTDRHLEV